MIAFAVVLQLGALLALLGGVLLGAAGLPILPMVWAAVIAAPVSLLVLAVGLRGMRPPA